MSSSSTEVVETDRLPRHVAIVMDGNGRWAERRRLPRFAGHKAGAGTVEQVVEICGELGVQVLTLFAFSSENWRRPEEEVGMLLGLFMTTLDKQVKKLHANNVSLRIIGERSAFSEKLQMQIAKAEELTRDNNGMNLVVAANYGGRWDIVRAARQVAQRVEDGSLAVGDISPQDLESGIALHD
ncbi:MAG: di-trans,poly-cis-decaprenylcistransferase, partial [Gammaproteobacteria bacterium]|nr:di-trans,poly-cis-decaprenylcistransferase [Gammaproteobacteria bacterium]